MTYTHLNIFNYTKITVNNTFIGNIRSQNVYLKMINVEIKVQLHFMLINLIYCN